METAVVDGASEDRALRVLELLDGGRVDGVLSLTALPSCVIARRRSDAAKLVIVEEFDDDLRSIGSLADASAMTEVVRTLAYWGHTKFLHIEGPQDWASARARKRVFNETIQALDLDAEHSEGDGWGPETGYRAIKSLSDSSEVTAIVAANDYIAIGAIRAAHERGWKVPAHLSVFGWDDLGVGRYQIPALSTVSVNRRGQGSHAMKRLIASVENEEFLTSEFARNQIILRESAGPAISSPR